VIASVGAALGFVGGALSGGIVLGVAMPATIAAVLVHARPSSARAADLDADTPADAPTATPTTAPTTTGPDTMRTTALALLVALAIVSAGVGARLIARQGFGYIPAIGAAKFADWVARPWEVSLADGLEAAALQMGAPAGFALAGLLMVGPTRQRCGAWIGITLAFVVAWTFAYGRGPALLTVPTAVLAGHGLIGIARHLHEPIGRLAAFVTIASAAIVAKDLVRIPELTVAILSRRPARDVPAEDALLHAEQLTALPLKVLVILVVISAVWAAAVQLDAIQRRVTPRIAIAVPTIALAGAAWTFAVMGWLAYLPHVHAQLSVAHHAQLLRTWDDAGLEIGRLVSTDRGLERYGPTVDHRAATRPELADWLEAGTPRVAIIRPSDLPGLWSDLRRRERPLHVLTAPHSTVLLVSNVVPGGAHDREPFADVVLTKAPALAHAVDLEIDGRIRLVGWEFTAPPRRGRDAELVLAFEVLRPVPSNLRMIAKLQRGRLSVAGRESFTPTEGKLPPGHWRVGDVIVVRRTIRLSRLEVLPGEHELTFALRRGEKDPLLITRPEPEAGAIGGEPAVSGPAASGPDLPEHAHPDAERSAKSGLGEVRVNARKTSAVIGTVEIR
jgi:hypothetical protein